MSYSDDDNENDDEDEEDETNNPTNPSPPTSPVVTTPTAGRLLAAQCAQCHGTDGYSQTGIDSLAGEGGEVIEEMLEMQAKNKNKVMHLQAKGYDLAQIKLIAGYFNSLAKNSQGDD